MQIHSSRPGRVCLSLVGRRRARSGVGAAALALFANAPVLAQAAAQADPVVVTATRTPQPLSQVLADVTLLTRDDIERQGAGALADLLRGVAGFELSRNGGPGGNTSLFLRGGESRFTAVLIDGMRIDSQSTGGAPWEAIPLAQIERIEILHGPASAVYGSDAIGGVVQIFTRRGDGPAQVELALGGGNLGTAKAEAGVSGRRGALDYALAATAERSDGFNAMSNPASSSFVADRDGYKNHGLSARLGVEPVAGQRLELVALSQRLDAQYDTAKAKANDDHSLHELDSLRASWSAQLHSQWRSQLSAGQASDRYETRPAPYRTDTRLRDFAWQNDVTLGAHTLSATLERREDRLENSSLSASPTPGQGERHQDSLALGHAWRAPGYALQLNLRHDRDSEFGTHNTGALAAGVELGRGWRVHASAGTAFRAPTLYQRFSVYGNPDLRPETAHNIEAGLRYRQERVESGLTLYRNRISDLINFSSAGVCASPKGCYRNTAQARLQGATLQARGDWARWRLSGSLDLQSPQDVQTGKLLRRRARQHLTLGADTDVAAWTVSAQVLAAGQRYNDDANTQPLGGYALLNLGAQWQMNREWRLQLRLDNAFDREYQTARDFASAPRTVFAGLRWTPGS